MGVAGRIGSGKDEVLKYLKSRYGIPYISTGDLVRSLAAREGLAPTRENLDIISERCFIEKGKGCFVRMAVEEIKKKGWKIAGISGIRAPADVTVLKELLGNSFILLKVDIPDARLRFKRVQERREKRDPSTFEEFLVQDSSEEELFHVSKTLSMANYTLKNDGTLEDLHRSIDSLVKSLNLPTV